MRPLGPSAVLLSVLGACVAAPNDVDCAFRRLAIEVASRNLGGDEMKLSAVATGLNASNCQGADAWLREASHPRPRAPVTADGAAYSFVFVAPNGSDLNAGSIDAPFRTLGKAAEAVRLLGPTTRPVGVMLRAGVYYESLALGPDDSGAAGAPVVWRSFPGERAVISGGERLACEWATVVVNGNVSARRCAVPDGLPSSFSSMFVNDKRLRRARFPNGDPAAPFGVPAAGYASAGEATDTVGHCPRNSAAVRGPLVRLDAASSGREFAHGVYAADGDGGALLPNVTLAVHDTEYVHDAGGFVNFGAREGGGVACYDASFNVPYWDAGSCNCRNFSTGEQLGTRPARWADVTMAVARMFHSNRWGGWAFRLAGYGAGDGAGVPPFLAIDRGGWQTGQQGTKNIAGNGFYVENVFEELDEPGEWFLDEAARALYVVPPSGVALDRGARVEVAVRARVVSLVGDAAGAGGAPRYVRHIALHGLEIAHSAPTFLAPYEIPSGGDWSVHRGGAIFVDGAEDIVIADCRLDQAGGNAITLSNHVWHAAVHDNVISRAGDSGVVLLGSTALMNGTRATYPAHVNVTGNLMHENGYYGKQTAAVFRSLAYRVTLARNVLFSSPRSLINVNDAFRGGDEIEGNVLFGAVTETADHASFNSWDRQPYFWQDSRDVVAARARMRPETMRVRRNLVLNKDYRWGTTNSEWAIDHDDASSYFDDSENVLVYGAHKWRDGVEKTYATNLYVTPPDARAPQQRGVGWYTAHTNRSVFVNNTMVNWGDARQFHFVWAPPTPSSDFVVANNSYYSPNSTVFVVANDTDDVACASLAEWQALCNCDEGANFSSDMDLDRVLRQARELLRLPALV